jgi:hypothetical protein
MQVHDPQAPALQWFGLDHPKRTFRLTDVPGNVSREIPSTSFRKGDRMRIPRLASLVGLALVFAPVLATADEATKPLTVELKSFSFNAPKGKEDLLKYEASEGRLCFFINGIGEAKVDVPKDGDYEIVIKASGDKALKEGAKFKVAVDGKPCGKETETSDAEPKDYTFATPLKAGEHKLAIEFTNDVYKEGEYDRNLYVHAVALKKVK